MVLAAAPRLGEIGVPRIEPLPESQTDPHLLAQMNDLVHSGQLGSGTTVWPRILALHPDSRVVRQHLDLIATNGTDAAGTLGARLRELLRLGNAQLVGCDACAEARYAPELDESAIACAIVGAGEELTDRERLALAFQRKFHLDHWSIDDETYRELGTVFSTVEIIELVDTISSGIGSGRFLHTLNMLSGAPPVLAWDHKPAR